MTLEQVLADAVEQANSAVETALTDSKARLIKIDRNGSKHFEGYVQCDRCGGTGTYVWGAIINGCPQYAGVCFKCGGAGKVWGKWIERTPEHQAKLDARRKARHEKEQAERRAYYEAETARIEAEKARKEAEEKARKAISQYVGIVGDKYNAEVTYTGSAHFEINSFRGYGREKMYVHFFLDDAENKIVWKTSNPLGKWLDNGDWLHYESGDRVMLKGTIKAHEEYKEEKQTVLTRAKVERGIKHES